MASVLGLPYADFTRTYDSNQTYDHFHLISLKQEPKEKALEFTIKLEKLLAHTILLAYRMVSYEFGGYIAVRHKDSTETRKILL